MKYAPLPLWWWRRLHNKTKYFFTKPSNLGGFFATISHCHKTKPCDNGISKNAAMLVCGFYYFFHDYHILSHLPVGLFRQFFVGIFCCLTKKMWISAHSDKNKRPCIYWQNRLSNIYLICRCPIACPMKMWVTDSCLSVYACSYANTKTDESAVADIASQTKEKNLNWCKLLWVHESAKTKFYDTTLSVLS